MNQRHELSDGEIEASKRLHCETNDACIRIRCDMILWSDVEQVCALKLAQPFQIASFIHYWLALR
jgi:hypothetical protein